MRAPVYLPWRLAHLLMFLVLVLAINPSFGQGVVTARAAAQTPPASPTQANTKTVNVELIFDSSGSMAEEITPGVTKINAAKKVLNDVIEAIPQRPGINVGFRVYGHKGSNSDADKAVSCQASDLIAPIKGVDKPRLRQAVATYQPVGWTPIALSLQRAAQDFKKPGESETNAVVLVTDGLETCGGDPCAAARALKESQVAVTTYVVGFGLTQQDQQTLQCIAGAGGGLNLSAGNTQELNKALFTVLEELQVVVQTGILEIEAFGGIFPKATITGTTGATDSNPQGKPFSLTLTTSNRVELNVGVYDVSWANPSGQPTKIKVSIEANQTTWIRGSLLKFPQGAGEIYVVKDQAGVVIWQDQFEQGDYVWVLPGIYRIELLERVGDPVLISAEVQTLPGTATQLEVFTAGS